MQDTSEAQQLPPTYQIDCVCEACDRSKPGKHTGNMSMDSEWRFSQTTKSSRQPNTRRRWFQMSGQVPVWW